MSIHKGEHMKKLMLLMFLAAPISCFADGEACNVKLYCQCDRGGDAAYYLALHQVNLETGADVFLRYVLYPDGSYYRGQTQDNCESLSKPAICRL